MTGGAGGAGGAGGGGPGPGVDACPDAPNAPGPVLDLAWPAASNVGHDAAEGQTVHFHWSGSHNVLQVASFVGQAPPLGPLSDAGWPLEIKSGPKQENGAFDWHTGAFPCGYRPGIYFFVDEENPAGGVVSATLTVDEFNNDHYKPRPCSELSDPLMYGGRYAEYASRPGCTVYEVNNFQTVAHFDWVPATFAAKQGDLVVFRWTSEHNVVQVHDVTKDTLVPGGITSGPKTNCVGGPHYLCANGPPSLGELLIDTQTYRPGMIHLSDECAYTCTGSPTGMNMQFLLKRPVKPEPPVPGSCCAINPAKGKECRVVEMYNDSDGLQFDYNVPVGRGDLVRFRWAGKLQVFQAVDESGAPGKTPKPGGVGMSAPVECTPGPDWTCLEGTTGEAELVFDVDEAIKKGLFEEDAFGNRWFDFYGLGDNTPGYSSADTGTIVYLDNSVPYNPSPTPCP
jgi:plastocyanin